MDFTPPMKLPLRRTPKKPGDHVIMNPALREWLGIAQQPPQERV